MTHYLVIARSVVDDLPIAIVSEREEAARLAEAFDPDAVDALPAARVMLGLRRASDASWVDVIRFESGLPVERVLHRAL